MIQSSHSDTYKLETTRVCANLLIMMLIAVVTSIIPLLLNNNSAIFYTSLPFYITVVILFTCIMYLQYWGIVIGVMSFLICGFVLELPLKILIINCIVNTFQIFLLLVAFFALKRLKIPNRNKYAQGIFYLSQYNFLLLILFILYILFCIFNSHTWITILYTFASATFVVTIIKVIVNKDLHLLFHTVCIALLPSLLCSTISALGSGVPSYLTGDYIFTWTFSNYILLQTCGYLIFQMLFTKSRTRLPNKEIVEIDLSSIAYYVAMLLWNLLIIYLLYSKILQHNIYIYFFPWILGNIFFGFNLCFSFYNDAENVTDKFAWYEHRVVVVEKNTSGIVTIITFLLPLSVSFIGNIPEELFVLFIANIFCACLSVGLIWVPSPNIKFIALLKSMKTIFYLYSITLLLISVIMIMFSKH